MIGHRLPYLHLDELPGVQAAAIRADRFTVPAALLSLLARATDERPVPAVIDDAQWLDDASLEAFRFAGRRLGQEGVVMLGAAREEGRRVEMPWLERMAVEPLPDADARALLEIPGLLSPGQLAGREPLEDPLRPETASSARSRRALLVAAAGRHRSGALARRAVAEPSRAGRGDPDRRPGRGRARVPPPAHARDDLPRRVAV